MTSQTDRMGTTPSSDQIRRAPKVLLHDHLDGGLRPGTIVDLARQTGYRNLPQSDPDKLGLWFREAADSGSLERYLETFSHTVGVMQTRDALFRVAAECVEDLAADGVVYAEVRYAPEQHLDGGLGLEEIVEAVNEGFREGERRAREPTGASASARCSPPCGTPPAPWRSPNSPTATATRASSASTSRAPRPATRPPATWTPSSS
jgi:adenosine deaminase